GAPATGCGNPSLALRASEVLSCRSNSNVCSHIRSKRIMATDIHTGEQTVHVERKRPESPGIAKANAAATRLERRLALLMILTPLVSLIVAIALLWEQAIGVTELALMLGMYSLGMFGITIGYHRLASHRAFQTYKPIRVLFAILGSMAGQGPVLYWAAIHRRHHQFSGHPGDPHSPNMHGEGAWGMVKGFWHGHTGWMFVHEITD